MVEAFLNLETDEQSEEFYNTLRYDVVLHCAEKPAGSLDRTALNFVASGDKPLWRGTFNAEVLRIDADAIANGSSMIGIDSWMQQGEDYLIKTSNPQNELSAEIRKKTCVDTAGKEFAYTVRVELDEAVFTGCAESLDIAFQENTLGKLATFLKKHQIAYTGKIPPEKANYSLITKGSLVEVIIWSTENM